MIYDTTEEKKEYLERIEELKRIISDSDPVALIIQLHTKCGKIHTLNKISPDAPIFQVMGSVDYIKKMLEKYIQ